jgi:uncharacterized RDD family membrane protein YckC
LIPQGGSEDAPRPGYYPDPSIPGYIRYWNGSSWVPGTSRPEPREGEPMPTPPSPTAASDALAAGPPPSRQAPSTEETGPVFLDEDPDVVGVVAQVPEARGGGSVPEVRPRGEVEPAASMDWDDPSRMYGKRPESASAWQADASWQAGFARQSEERVSWGHGEGGGASGLPGEGGSAADALGGQMPGEVEAPTDSEARTDGEARTDSAASPPAEVGPGPVPESAPESAPEPPPEAAPEADPQAFAEGGTFQMRALGAEELRKAAGEAKGTSSDQHAPEHTVRMRAMSVEELRKAAGEAKGTSSDQHAPEHTVRMRRSDILKPNAQGMGSSDAGIPTPPSVPGQGAHGQPQAQATGPRPQAAQATQAAQPAQSPPARPAHPQPSYGQYGQQSQQGQYGQQSQQGQQGQQAPGYAQVPSAQGGFGQGAPAQAPWAQQVQDLAGAGAAGGASGQQGGGPEAMTPWKPPSSDPFLQAASQQEARPAGLGRRFGARLVDGVLTAAVAVGAAFPFAGDAVDHIEAKTDAVRRAGETKQVWLIDGTTGGYLAIVLGALVLFGLLYEVLPTRSWGRTLGKKMFGLKVLTMEQHGRPGFGSALMRWLTHGVLWLVAVGVLNVLWCLFDRPWRQCWHDKVAGTFVSRGSGEIRLR